MAVDEILSPHYNEITRREDYLKLLNIIIGYSFRVKNDPWVSFSSHYIRNEFPQRRKGTQRVWVLSELLKVCTQVGVLDYHQYSTFTNQTRKYKFSDRFLDKIISREIEIYSYDIMVRNPEIYYKIEENNPQYQLLSSPRFTVDFKGASNKIWDMIIENNLSPSRYLKIQNTLINLFKKKIYCSTAPSGRVYTSFNGIKREVRPFCMIDGVFLESLDLKCSQPTIFAHLLKNKYPNNEAVKAFYILSTDPQRDIYTFLGDQAGLSRDASKVEFLTYLYKDNRGACLYQDLLRTKWPDLHEVVQEEKNVYDSLAVELQRIESRIFINHLYPLFTDGVLSVHDGVYFKPDLKEDVLSRLKEGFSREGITRYELH
jgi:hypothetical protein